MEFEFSGRDDDDDNGKKDSPSYTVSISRAHARHIAKWYAVTKTESGPNPVRKYLSRGPAYWDQICEMAVRA